jgi:hypothetical protein
MHNQGNKHEPKKHAASPYKFEAGRLPDQSGGDIGEPGQSAQPARGGAEGEGYDPVPQGTEVRAAPDNPKVIDMRGSEEGGNGNREPYETKARGDGCSSTFKQATSPGYNVEKSEKSN